MKRIFFLALFALISLAGTAQESFGDPIVGTPGFLHGTYQVTNEGNCTYEVTFNQIGKAPGSLDSYCAVADIQILHPGETYTWPVGGGMWCEIYSVNFSFRATGSSVTHSGLLNTPYTGFGACAPEHLVDPVHWVPTSPSTFEIKDGILSEGGGGLGSLE